MDSQLANEILDVTFEKVDPQAVDLQQLTDDVYVVAIPILVEELQRIPKTEEERALMISAYKEVIDWQKEAIACGITKDRNSLLYKLAWRALDAFFADARNPQKFYYTLLDAVDINLWEEEDKNGMRWAIYDVEYQKRQVVLDHPVFGEILIQLDFDKNLEASPIIEIFEMHGVEDGGKFIKGPFIMSLNMEYNIVPVIQNFPIVGNNRIAQ